MSTKPREQLEWSPCTRPKIDISFEIISPRLHWLSTCATWAQLITARCLASKIPPIETHAVITWTKATLATLPGKRVGSRAWPPARTTAMVSNSSAGKDSLKILNRWLRVHSFIFRVQIFLLQLIDSHYYQVRGVPWLTTKLFFHLLLPTYQGPKQISSSATASRLCHRTCTHGRY